MEKKIEHHMETGVTGGDTVASNEGLTLNPKP